MLANKKCLRMPIQVALPVRLGLLSEAHRAVHTNRLLCRHRLEEMRTAAKLLGSLANGSPAPGLKFHDAASDFMASLAGRLDMDCLACIGHSFGGGPSCALPAESGLFKCGIGMDPYW